MSGAALDTAAWEAWKPALIAAGFRWYGGADLVHFDFIGPGVLDLRAANLKAFQQLNNKHNPSQPIPEDGVYTAATADALNRAPCDGW